MKNLRKQGLRALILHLIFSAGYAANNNSESDPGIAYSVPDKPWAQDFGNHRAEFKLEVPRSAAHVK